MLDKKAVRREKLIKKNNKQSYFPTIPVSVGFALRNFIIFKLPINSSFHIRNYYDCLKVLFCINFRDSMTKIHIKFHVKVSNIVYYDLSIVQPNSKSSNKRKVSIYQNDSKYVMKIFYPQIR